MPANAPTLINLPPPPSDPVTPSDMGPGTPNSTTTSMSELSTVAIKDGHRGHLPHHSSSQAPPFTSNTSHTSTLDAERADRISRLAGLERVTGPRSSPFNPNQPTASYPSGATASTTTTPTAPGYFDPSNPTFKERSTVGSASATGSVGGRTTWASGSDSGLGAPTDPDKMSETTQDPDELSSTRMDAASTSNLDDMETSSTGGFSDDANASLVGFGEGARTPARHSGIGSPTALTSSLAAQSQPKPGSAVPMHLYPATADGRTASAGAGFATTAAQTVPATEAAQATRDARMIDGMTYDDGSPFVDTAAGRTPPPTSAAAAGLGARSPEPVRGDAERIVRENLERGEETAERPMGEAGKAGLGRFYFEGKGGQ
ncbi:MAG: hypothetical protein Q9165_002330 [Trypethelium subeluteriae]